MNVLFVHNNFPAQFRRIAQRLAAHPDCRVAALGSRTARAIPGVRLVKYSDPIQNFGPVHPFARRFDLDCRRAEEVLYSLSSLLASGFVPDLIFAHPGWGETIPLRTLFPKARMLVYCEFFYAAEGRDVGFDPEFPVTGVDGHIALHARNATTLLALSEADAGIAPTAWQRSTFPREFQPKIEIIHEGIDIEEVRPNAQAALSLPGGLTLRAGDEVITFVARNLEPLRGYHIFIRSLPQILKARPNAHVIIVGGDGVSYGAAPPAGSTWQASFLKEISGQFDSTRVHFMGRVPRSQFLQILQVSAVHVYLTYPFVLSWSLLEAMASQCLVIASDTAPLRDVIDGKNGVLTPFFDVKALATQVITALANPKRFARMRVRARRFIETNYDAEKVCLPSLMKLVQASMGDRPEYL